MWIVNSKTRSEKATDPDFMPFPQEFEDAAKKSSPDSNPLGNTVCQSDPRGPKNSSVKNLSVFVF